MKIVFLKKHLFQIPKKKKNSFFTLENHLNNSVFVDVMRLKLIDRLSFTYIRRKL